MRASCGPAAETFPPSQYRALDRRATPLLERGAAGDADAEDVEPALAEIEQMRVEQRRDDVLHDDDHADPGDKPAAAEQHQVRRPHRQQYRRAEKAKLDGDGENLIVRIDRRLAGGAGFADLGAAKFL